MASVRQVSSKLDAGGRHATPGLSHEIADLVRALQGLVVDRYRPELHYMRGPGPKWHAKHDPAAAAIPSHAVPALMRASA